MTGINAGQIPGLELYYNTVVGEGSYAMDVTNSAVVGAQAVVASDNTIQLGNAAIELVNTSGTVSASAFKGNGDQITIEDQSTGDDIRKNASNARTLVDIIRDLEFRINQLENTIASLQSDISTNQSSISTNQSSIYTNQSSIADNQSSIAANVSNISTNQSSIAANVSNISTNQSNISYNQSNISTNQININDNIQDIATNKLNIDMLTAETILH